MRIKISTYTPTFPAIRQTPESKGLWGDCEFVGDDAEDCDFWVVYEKLPHTETTLCPEGNTLFISGEPPSVKWYNPLFLRQFETVLTTHKKMLHKNVILGQTGLPWIIGAKYSAKEKTWKPNYDLSYDELKAMEEVRKDRNIAVITSDKTMTKGHRLRLDFVRRLESALGNDIDVFITGKTAMEDKWDTVGRYRYHIAIENFVYPHYWTEKISDPLLGLSHPFYYGCPNLEEYFPKESFTRIDINDFETSITTIQKALESDRYLKSLSSMKVAKSLILEKYNLYPMLAELCHRLDTKRSKVGITIKPELVIPTKLEPKKDIEYVRRLLASN